MLKRLSIRQRILLTFLLIVLTGGLVQLVIAGQQLRSATLEFYQHHLEKDALLIAATLSEPLEAMLEEDNRALVSALLSSLQREVNHDFVILDANYRALVFTPGTGYTRGEIVPLTHALDGTTSPQIGVNIRGGPDGQETLFIAAPVLYEGEILGYLGLSRPMQPAYDEVMRQWLELGGATLPVIGLVIAASLWLSGTISRPVQDLRTSALRMAEGALDTRINNDAQDEVGQLARTFNHMAQQIEQLLKTQRSFVSNAAHELRTPLMTLKLRMEALEDGDLSEAEAHQYLREVGQEVDYMAELVKSLLILARIDEGRHQSSGAVSDTASALHDIARHWRIAAKQAGLQCEPDIPDELPSLPLSLNDLRLVLDNLMGNAIKYTPAGRVHFSATTLGDQVILCVTDTGLGFDAAHAENLFTRFYRSDEARVHAEGNGLGLSIVRGVLRQYGASITAESAGPGQGAAFTVRIPVSDAI